MRKSFKMMLSLLLLMVGVVSASAEGGVIQEKTLFKTNFQDWDNVDFSTTPVDVAKKLTTGEDLTFTLFNTKVDNAGTNAKFTEECVTPGYLMTNKDATNVPYILTSAIPDITTLTIVQAATGGTRGMTLAVKGDGDADWVVLHNKSVVKAAGETLTFDINRKNCQIKIGTFAPAQNAYILSMVINGNVEVPARTFTDFKVDFRSNPYTVISPATLPENVTINPGSFNGSQHGAQNPTVTVAVDGPVKFKIGSCQFGSALVNIEKNGEALTQISNNFGCENAYADLTNATYDKFASWTYNSEEPATLTFKVNGYCPFFIAEACEYIADVTVTYFDANGIKIGEEVVDGGSELAFKYSEADLTIPEGKAFRGWFDSKLETGLKVKAGLVLTEDIKLYAHVTDIEVVNSTTRFSYDLTKPYFYVEDHEAIEIDGSYYNSHGWLIGSGKSLKIKVADKAYVTIGNCFYTTESTAKVTNEAGEEVATFQAKADADGAVHTFQYDGTAGWLTITFPSGAYVHKVSVWNVVDFIQYDEEAGYYQVPASDVSSFLLALESANSTGNTKIFLPNGTYDLGATVLTSVSGKNISIIGESMEGTIIKNAPLLENEGIGTTATIFNSSDGLYLQDLTLHNDMHFTGGTGRAVCLQDKGKNTICKNVRLLSYQDTYYSNSASRFYWEDSEIHGVVDYICGDGDVVYNRCKFVNEAIKNTTLAAPYTSASCQWGYVLLDCDIETLCPEFNLGRSWGGESKLQYIRCKDLSNKLVASRWTLEGMNIAAYKFKEYGMMAADGSITTPASNVVTFKHSSGNLTYETVLSEAEAAQYTVANIYGSWAPDVTCKQEELTAAEVSAPDASGVYLVDGKIYVGQIPSGAVTARKANGRGGFGPAFDVATSIKGVTSFDEVANAPVYNVAGQRVNGTAKGLLIQNGKKMIVR